MTEYLVLLGAAIQFAGIVVYIRDTVKGRTKPNRVTWTLWALAPLIACLAAWKAGSRLAILPIFISGFDSLLVLCASFVNKNAYWKLGAADYTSGVISVLALILWQTTGDAGLAIIFAIASDTFASLPTYIKSWKNPETESGFAYTTVFLNACISFAVIQNRDFVALAFPVYLILQSLIFIFFIYRKKFLSFKS